MDLATEKVTIIALELVELTAVTVGLVQSDTTRNSAQL
jgi:hypothetical protein